MSHVRVARIDFRILPARKGFLDVVMYRNGTRRDRCPCSCR
jgi:hypothetical protein